MFALSESTKTINPIPVIALAPRQANKRFLQFQQVGKEQFLPGSRIKLHCGIYSQSCLGELFTN
jgi:hypothetical protein